MKALVLFFADDTTLCEAHNSLELLKSKFKLKIELVND